MYNFGLLTLRQTEWKSLTNDAIEDKRAYNTTAADAITKALEGTRWQLGSVEGTPIGSVNFYYTNAFKALADIQEVWGVRLRFRVTMAGNGISTRVVDILPTTGEFKGKRFEYGRDLLEVQQTVSLASTVTALYGRGKAEQVSENGYGRKLTFSDVAWSVSAGDPVDKPLGQEWVGDNNALAAWGHNGRHRYGFVEFNECDDAEELLRLTWEALQANSKPRVEYSMNVLDLERLAGYAHDAVRLYDRVHVVDTTFNPPLYLEADVIGIERSYCAPERTRIMLGNYTPSIIDAQAKMITNVNRLLGKEAVYDESWSDVLDVMSTQIISSGTHFETSKTDGSFLWVSDDGTKCVKITGGGVLIANSKTAGNWNWQTAMSGDGVVASVLTSGTLQTGLVTIMGSNRFFWDSENIHIRHQTDAMKEIRIGRYDGVNYGIGYTKDGGATWNAITGFDGLVLSGDFISLNASNIVNAVRSSELYRGDLYYGRNFCLGTAQEFDFVNGYYNGSNQITLPLSADYLQVSGARKVRISFDIRRVSYATSQSSTLWVGLVGRSGSDSPTPGSTWGTAVANQNWTRVTLGAFNYSGYNFDALDSIELVVYSHTGLLGIRRIKVEYGDEFTSWVAANEDMEGVNTQLTVQQGMIEARVTSDDMDSALTVLNGQISSKVSAGSIISTINQSAEAVSINASKVNINGAVSINEGFKVNTDGTFVAKAGVVGGFSTTATKLMANNLVLDAGGDCIRLGNNKLQILSGDLQLLSPTAVIITISPESDQQGAGKTYTFDTDRFITPPTAISTGANITPNVYVDVNGRFWRCP